LQKVAAIWFLIACSVGKQAAAVRKALADALSTTSPKPGVIVVVPQTAKNGETPATGSKNAPPLR